jgi:hypothetical protein
MAKKKSEGVVEAERLHLVYFDAQEDRLKCIVGNVPEDIALKIAELPVDCAHIVIKGTRIDSIPRENVAVVAIGGVDYKVTRSIAGTDVAIANPQTAIEASTDEG